MYKCIWISWLLCNSVLGLRVFLWPDQQNHAIFNDFPSPHRLPLFPFLLCIPFCNSLILIIPCLSLFARNFVSFLYDDFFGSRTTPGGALFTICSLKKKFFNTNNTLSNLRINKISAEKTSWNNSNTVLVIQRRGRVVTENKNRLKVFVLHYN